jgi:aryl-alcohol dehydrogenase-like predicted oxidoreductase
MELGVSLFDTADAYGTGHSEEVLGRALQDVRKRVVVATKAALCTTGKARDQRGGYLARRVHPQGAGGLDQAASKPSMWTCIRVHNGTIAGSGSSRCSRSLTNCGLRQDPRLRLEHLYESDVEAFAAKTKGTVIQTKANLFTYDGAVHAACESHGFACLCNTPLGMGFPLRQVHRGHALRRGHVRGSSFAWTEYFKNGRPKREFLQRIAAVREALQSGGRTGRAGRACVLWAKSPPISRYPALKP